MVVPANHLSQTTRLFLVATLVSLLFALTSCVDVTQASASDAERQAILRLMHNMFDKPETPLKVDPLLVEANFAIASWTQGEMGGRALLRKHANGWSIVLCSGDQIKAATAMMSAGVPQTVAEKLAKDLDDAERELDAARRVQLSKFDGMVMFDGSEHRSPSQHHK